MTDPNTFFGLNEVEALLIGALIALVAAAFTIFSQRSITARHSTINFIRDSQSDRDLLTAREVFTKLALHPDGLHQFANKPLAPELAYIITTLNQFEIVAIGIQLGIFDDTTYRRWNKSGVIKSWEAAAPFIYARRAERNNEALWHEFEELARWYRGTPTMPHRRFVWRKFI